MLDSIRESKLHLEPDPIISTKKTSLWTLWNPICVFATALVLLGLQGHLWDSVIHDSATSLRCPEQIVLRPSRSLDICRENLDLFRSVAFRNSSAQKLSGAVKVPTVSYDGMGKVGEDERWEIFCQLGDYLEKTFPIIYEQLGIRRINEHALLYIWKGANVTLKPLLFMAHQDVVPVPNSTIPRWTFDPFSGHYDDTFVWGRGSEDDKSNLIAMLIAIESLLNIGFKPDRTLILAVGFDEEGGFPESYGAKALAHELLEEYGPNSMEMIFDEGIAGIETHFGTHFAMPATAEKGYVDITVTIDTEGGHSSTPPDHTAIGYLADIIKLVESNQFESSLSNENPTTTYLSCMAEYASNMPQSLRESILDPYRQDDVIEYMDQSLDTRALLRTSSAIDVIHGGSKANNLPESAYILVNHRIAVDQSVQTVKDYYIKLLQPYARERNFTLCAFLSDSGCVKPGIASISLSAQDELEPSPSTDTTDPRFSWVTGTLRGVFGEDVIVAPVLLSGNTDTKYYWRLSDQIYRMSPWRANLDPRGTNMHTVDERMPIDGLLEMITFYHEFIRVVDEMRY